MRHEIKKKLIELDLRSYELSKELEKAKGIEIDDADLEGLRKKAGDRVIVIARNALVEDDILKKMMNAIEVCMISLGKRKL